MSIAMQGKGKFDFFLLLKQFDFKKSLPNIMLRLFMQIPIKET